MKVSDTGETSAKEKNPKKGLKKKPKDEESSDFSSDSSSDSSDDDSDPDDVGPDAGTLPDPPPWNAACVWVAKPAGVQGRRRSLSLPSHTGGSSTRGLGCHRGISIPPRSSRAPTLGLPNYSLPFHLYVATQPGVLAQEHGGGMRPCAFLSKSLDSVAQGLPACLRAVASCALMVTDAEKIVLSHPLILHTSHQAAELFALTRACVLAEDTDVTIYTDSRYAFGVAHDFGRIWQSRGFTTADGKPISHASLVQDLITACHLPRSLAIVKTKAHSSGVRRELKINWHFHIPYHPQSSGIVERANRTIKDKIRKAMHASGSKNWLHALPLVLADMRMTAQVALDHLSPYELVMGRPFPLPWRRGKQAVGTGDLDVHLSEYAAGLLQTLDDYWTRVNARRPPIRIKNTHPFKHETKDKPPKKRRYVVGLDGFVIKALPLSSEVAGSNLACPHTGEKYAQYLSAQVVDSQGRTIRDTKSSFYFHLTQLTWVPAYKFTHDGKQLVDYLLPNRVYLFSDKVHKLLGSHVYYANLDPSEFSRAIGKQVFTCPSWFQSKYFFKGLSWQINKDFSNCTGMRHTVQVDEFVMYLKRCCTK
ncbi:hypothetical protein C0J45_6612 [Silurus meridionalis]|nr:hypothetical protein C0J45_6612 [Silurus meridionalis]